MTAREPLTGAELVAKVKELAGASKSELVRACGYVSITGEGRERLNYTAFSEAWAIAHGAPSIKAPKGPGRRLSYLTRVVSNGTLVIGDNYVKEMGLVPGDRVAIKISRRGMALEPAAVA